MKFKFAFALLTFSVALFASGRFVFISHNQSFGNVAWAQDAGDSEQGSDVTSQPAVTPPDVQGSWSGPIADATFGSTTLTIDIFQNHSKVKGGWMTGNGGSGKFKGVIKSDGVTVLLRFKGKRGCKVTAPGTLVSATELSGTYTSKHCTGVSGGDFDLTHQ